MELAVAPRATSTPRFHRPKYFPLKLRFKLLALAPQIQVCDTGGTLLLHVKQKLFKLKEDIVIFADAEQTQPLYRIGADRVIDFGAAYAITDSTTGEHLGAIRQKGLRSLWRAEYEISGADGGAFTVREESVIIRMLDRVFSDLPVVGMFAGYVFNAAYRVTRDGSDEVIMRAVKTPALFEGHFRLELRGTASEPEQRLLALSALMMLLLERRRS